jgi:lipopolysaccharide/colanic/teichoic acid biosynthesis glycosyltransferase
VAAIALTLLTPLLLAVALVIRLDSRGAVFFRQVRAGYLGRPFTIFKFRTMVPGADKLGSSVTTAADARVTRVGRILRRTKLDELPQLWNVVRGEMALVGPRPDVPEVVAGYTPEMKRVLTVLPGLTSVASLELVDEEGLLVDASDPDDFYLNVLVPAKVSYAMVHVEDRSLALELTTIWRTAVASVRRLIGTPNGGALTYTLRERLVAARITAEEAKKE